MEETAEGHGLSELPQPRRDVPGGGGAEGRAALPLDKAGRDLSGDLLARDRGGHRRIRAPARDAGPRDELCVAHLRRRRVRCRDWPVLPDDAGARHRHRLDPAVLHARAQQARGRRPRGEAEGAGARALRALAPRCPGVPAASAQRRARDDAAREIRRGARGLGPALRGDHGGVALPDRGQGPRWARCLGKMRGSSR